MKLTITIDLSSASASHNPFSELRRLCCDALSRLRIDGTQQAVNLYSLRGAWCGVAGIEPTIGAMIEVHS